MKEEHSRDKEGETDNTAVPRGPLSLPFSSEKDRDSKSGEAANNREYADDEAGRFFNALGRWLLIRFFQAKFVDIVGVITGTVLVTVGIVAAVIYDGQLKEMRHTNELTQEALRKADVNSNGESNQFQVQLHHFDASLGQTKILAGRAIAQANETAKLANDTHILAEAAKTQAAATQSMAVTAKDSIYEEQRPWLGIAEFTTDSKGLPSMVIKIHNTGRTPANSVHFICCESRSSLFPGVSFPGYDSLKSADNQNSVSERAERYKKYHGSNPALLQKKLMEQAEQDSEDALKELEGGKVIPPDGSLPTNLAVSWGGKNINFFIGKITYRDVFDPAILHTTDFCLTQFEHSNLSFCDFGQKMQ